MSLYSDPFSEQTFFPGDVGSGTVTSVGLTSNVVGLGVIGTSPITDSGTFTLETIALPDGMRVPPSVGSRPSPLAVLAYDTSDFTPMYRLLEEPMIPAIPISRVTALQTALDDDVPNAKLPSAITDKTYNGLTLSSLSTGFSISGGTLDKILTVGGDSSVDGILTGTNSGDITLSGQNYLTISGQVITIGAVNLSGSHVTGVLDGARFPALTGDVITLEGSLDAQIAPGVVGTTELGASSVTSDKIATGAIDLGGSKVTGTLAGARFPVLTGDVTTSGGSLVTDISAGAVGATELANNAVTTDKLLDASVTSGKIAAGAISQDKVAAAQVTITGTDIDWSLGNLFFKSVTGSTTFSFSNLVDGKAIRVVIEGTGTATFPATVKWASPIQTSGTPILGIASNAFSLAAGALFIEFSRMNGQVYGIPITGLSTA